MFRYICLKFKKMQTIIKFNVNDVDFSFFEKLKEQYANKEASLIINEISKTKVSQKEIWEEMEEVRKKYPPFIVSPDIDLSELANEVNL